MVSGQFDLVFADPPFNIGYVYDQYRDIMPKRDYLNWTTAWLTQAKRLLKPTGSFFVAIGDEYAAEIKLALDATGMVMRNWLVWHYTFGVNCKKKFARCHTHIFYYVADEHCFTFNADAIKVKSKRQEIGDKRASSGGKIPDDVWQVSRLCGTFHERTAHPCQMPQEILERIIKVSTNEGDWILDPFAGSGTTLDAATRLKRSCVGVELSAEYCALIRQRLERTASRC